MRNVCDVAVLTGDDRVLASVVSCQSVHNAKCCGVVGSKHCVKSRAVCIVGGQDVLESGLCSVSCPVEGSYFIFCHLTRRNNQLTCIDVRLKNVHSAAEEEVYVVVARVACYHFNVERSVLVLKIQSVYKEFTLCLTYQVVIEGCIVGNCIRVHDQTVICDNRDACFFCLCKNGSKGVAVDGSNNQKLVAVSDHVLDLGSLCSGIISCILKVYYVAFFFQLSLHVFAVLVPSLKILCRHCNADRFTFCTSGKSKTCQHCSCESCC